MEKNFVVGIDIGGQTSKIGVVDADGNILDRAVIRTDSYGDDADAYLSALADAVTGLVARTGKTGQIRGIGACAPDGNYYTGAISYTPNIVWAENRTVDFNGKFSAALGGIPVMLTNDANAAAVGEMTYGAAKGMKHFIMITLGTGLGSGIVIDGKVVYGYDGFAGELGHICAVRENGRLCGCGKTGCLEAYCSATGVARTAREWLDGSDEPSLLRGIEKVSSKDVYDAAKAGDALSLRIFEYTGRMLGQSFADFIAFSAPQAIILFGGLARAGEFLYGPIVKAMNENVMPIWKNRVRIMFSQLKESDAAILGASALIW